MGTLIDRDDRVLFAMSDTPITAPTPHTAVGGRHAAAHQHAHVVKPTAVPDASLMTTVVELVNDLSTTTQRGAAHDAREKVLWVQFEHADLNDDQYAATLSTMFGGNRAPLLVFVALQKGYQDNGDCEQLLSDRRGPVEHACLLPQPRAHADQPTVVVDNYAHARPLIALCDGSTTARGGTHTVTFTSVVTGKQVSALRVDHAIRAVHASQSAICVSTNGRIVVICPLTLQQRCTINGGQYSDDSAGTVCALRHSWLAYAQNQLSPVHQSCGGVVVDNGHATMTGTVLTAAKTIGKGVTALTDTVSSALGAKACSVSPGGQHATPGVVTVIDLARVRTNDVNVVDGLCGLMDDADVAQTTIMSHFAALVDERVAALAFSDDAQLVAVAGSGGHCCHVFRLLPHPTSPRMSAVHHLYTCERGNTPARVLDLRFNHDARWLAMSTNHGTTHVFAVTPYGGRVSMRSHGGARVVNKETGFMTSSGMLETTTPPSSNSPVSHHGSASSINRADNHQHPALASDEYSAHVIKATHDPRLPPYPSPVVIAAAKKIRQTQLTAANISSRAVDMSSPVLPSSLTDSHSSSTSLHSSNKSLSGSSGFLCTDTMAVKCAFAAGRHVGHRSSSTHEQSLYVMNGEGTLVEHAIGVRPASKDAKYKAETDIKVTVTPTQQWLLHRTKATIDTRPPFDSPNDCALIPAAHAVQAKHTALATTRSPTGGGKSKRCGVHPAANAQPSAQRAWLSQIEMRTYSAPARRVWLGPQFTFKTVNDGADNGGSVKLVAVDTAAEESLVTDAPLVVVGKKGKKKKGGGSGTNSGTTTPPTVAQAATTVQRSQPIRIGGRSVPVVLNTAAASVDSTHTTVTLDVCGSWSDNDFIATSGVGGDEPADTRVRQSIADAMHDAHVDAPMEDARSEFSSQGSSAADTD